MGKAVSLVAQRPPKQTEKELSKGTAFATRSLTATATAQPDPLRPYKQTGHMLSTLLYPWHIDIQQCLTNPTKIICRHDATSPPKYQSMCLIRIYITLYQSIHPSIDPSIESVLPLQPRRPSSKQHGKIVGISRGIDKQLNLPFHTLTLTRRTILIAL